MRYCNALNHIGRYCRHVFGFSTVKTPVSEGAGFSQLNLEQNDMRVSYCWKCLLSEAYLYNIERHAGLHAKRKRTDPQGTLLELESHTKTRIDMRLHIPFLKTQQLGDDS